MEPLPTPIDSIMYGTEEPVLRGLFSKQNIVLGVGAALIALCIAFTIALADMNNVSRSRALTALFASLMWPVIALTAIGAHNYHTGFLFVLLSVFILIPVVLGYNQKKIKPLMIITTLGVGSWIIFFIAISVLPY